MHGKLGQYRWQVRRSRAGADACITNAAGPGPARAAGARDVFRPAAGAHWPDAARGQPLGPEDAEQARGQSWAASITNAGPVTRPGGDALADGRESAAPRFRRRRLCGPLFDGRGEVGALHTTLLLPPLTFRHHEQAWRL